MHGPQLGVALAPAGRHVPLTFNVSLQPLDLPT